MKNVMLAALAVLTGLLVSTCTPSGSAFAVAMPYCATGQGDTNEDAMKFLGEKWPEDNLYLLEGDDMDKAIAAAKFVMGVNTSPPADATELWISSGPSDNGNTAFVVFAGDCYLGSFDLTPEKFTEAMSIAFPDGLPEPVRKPSNPTNHKPIPSHEGERSA